jgi:hypothetical protein
MRVPQGQLSVAQDGSPGSLHNADRKVPQGTAECQIVQVSSFRSASNRSPAFVRDMNSNVLGR